MRGELAGTIAVLLGTAAGAPPATAVRATLGVTGAIDVYPDLGACGTLRFTEPVVAVGELSAAGLATGPGSAVAPVRGATPVLVSGGTYWHGCLPDAYAGATTARAVYTLTASSAAGDYAEVLTCAVHAGAVTC